MRLLYLKVHSRQDPILTDVLLALPSIQRGDRLTSALSRTIWLGLCSVAYGTHLMKAVKDAVVAD